MGRAATLVAAFASVTSAATTSASDPAPPPAATPAPAVSETGGTWVADDYRIGAGDLIQISVVGEPELDKRVRVPESGAITFTWIGEVSATGMTVTELESTIAARLAEDYLVDPQVNVLLLEYQQPTVDVLGEVNSPGPYRIERGDTVMDVIAKARGFTALANRGRVKVLRESETGRAQEIEIDTDEITEDGELDKNIEVHPGDRIIVPERFF